MNDTEGAPGPEAALQELSALLRDQSTVIAPHVLDSTTEPALGLLAASGRRAACAPGRYAMVVEAVREGYLLHYGEPRLLAGQDPGLALLAGDYLYALGLERLTSLGDGPAVSELSDLISLCAELHAEGLAGAVAPLWLAVSAAVGGGSTPELGEAKDAARRLDPAAAGLLWGAARAASGDRGEALARAAEAIDFLPPN